MAIVIMLSHPKISSSYVSMPLALRARQTDPLHRHFVKLDVLPPAHERLLDLYLHQERAIMRVIYTVKRIWRAITNHMKCGADYAPNAERILKLMASS